MTLIINVTTAKKVIQAADRRLTFPDGSLSCDKANKTVCVGCKDAHFAIAYTGLAFIGKERTDLWLVNYLTSISASNMTVPSITDALEKKVTSCLKSIPRKFRRTSFVLAGYRLGMPFTALISNFESYEPRSSGEAQDHFQSHVRQVRGPIRNSKRGLWIDTFGCEIAVKSPITRRIKRLARKRFFHKETGSVNADNLVSLIRAYAKTQKYGYLVGRNCMTVVIKPRFEEPILTKYHPEMNSPVQYLPHLITGNEKIRISFKDIEVWTEKPPWW